MKNGNIIEVSGLKKVFTKKVKMGLFTSTKSDFEAVKGIDFSVKKGERVALIGPNGAGKSTTIKMLTGILHPTEGVIRVAGYDPAKDRKELAYKIGCLFGQKSGLWMHLPAIDSYKLFGAIYDIDEEKLNKRINELVDLFEIKDLVNIPVRRLSLGQRMICEIVGVLIHEPEIIFLDEPTIGLDIMVKERVRRLIDDINQKTGVTVFLTSHDMSDIEKICDRVIIIDEGRIIMDENIASLKSKYLRESTKVVKTSETVPLEEIIYDIYSKED